MMYVKMSRNAGSELKSFRCERLKTMGFDCDGAYAEYAAVPEFNLHPLPENVSYDQAAAVQVRPELARLGQAKERLLLAAAHFLGAQARAYR